MKLTHCVCVIQKTTDCGVFSCQRVAVARGRRRRRAMVLPVKILESVVVAASCSPPTFALCATVGTLRLAKDGLPPEAAERRRVVENTGLEPVTSWLQTR